jgi:hypothetical protein
LICYDIFPGFSFLFLFQPNPFSQVAPVEGQVRQVAWRKYFLVVSRNGMLFTSGVGGVFIPFIGAGATVKHTD